MRLSGAISPDKSVHIDIRTGKGKITSPTWIAGSKKVLI